MLQKLGLGAVAIVVIAALLWHPPPRPAWTAASPSPLASSRSPESRRTAASAALVVYVAGAVARPGLYALRDGSRAADAVARAGGLRADADSASVNLAQRVSDGDEVDVAVMGERPARSRSRTSGSRFRRSRSAHTRSGRSRRDDDASPSNDVSESAVDVNTADAAALTAVPGIGRSIAGRIVELRERTGPFATLDELLDVAGMTQSRLERARPYLHEP
ncbi:MAG: ComEA family DNA-binding protein [Candidatus Tumulicola sp.]